MTRFSKKGPLTLLTKKEKKTNVVKEAITPPISEKKKIDTVNKTEKPQAPNKKVDTPKSNKTDKVKPIYKSRSAQLTDTFTTVDKSRYIPGNNVYNISTRIENPTEIDIVKDNRDLSDLSLPGYD